MNLPRANRETSIPHRTHISLLNVQHPFCCDALFYVSHSSKSNHLDYYTMNFHFRCYSIRLSVCLFACLFVCPSLSLHIKYHILNGLYACGFDFLFIYISFGCIRYHLFLLVLNVKTLLSHSKWRAYMLCMFMNCVLIP